MTNPIRGLVSKRRIRYTQDGFDLDLTYINDRIIAMGYPAEHMESIYRNKIEDVQKMLEKNHAGCYKIYNLCSERSYNHKRFPYYSVYPFKDHNPPDIELITSFCQDVDEHLRADGKNVVAVHCKAGKGRTGTMICCYLLYSRQFNTAGEALNYYAQRRTSDSKGVTIPSQRRYVEYYATLLRSNETYRSVTLYICEIRLTPTLNVKEGTINVTGKSPQPLPEFKRTDDKTAAKLDYCLPLTGDVKIEFTKSSVLRKEKRCHFWFNTYFVEKSARKDAEGNLLLELSKTEIDDAHKDKHHKEFPNNFTVELVLRRVPPGKFSESVSLKKCHPSAAVTASPLIKCTMENNRQQHLPSQQILLQQQQQQHQSPHQQQLMQHGQHPLPHRQVSCDPFRPTLIKHQNSYIDGNTNSVLSGGYLHDPLHHQQQNSLPAQQNNHHHPQQQQHVSTQQQQLAYQSMHEQYHLDENNHCLEYSETSSSESSTEEEGWDSGECPTLLQAPDNLYSRNDNYYYGSCAGLSAGSSDPSAPVPTPHPAPHLPTSTSSSATTSSPAAPLITNSSGSSAANHNLNDSSSSRLSNNTIGSLHLYQSLANTTFAASTSSKSSVVPDSITSSGVFSTASLTFQDSLPSLTKCHRVSNNSSSNNGKLPSSAELLTTANKVTTPSAINIGWQTIGLKRKKKKSFKLSTARNFVTAASREFGSNISACSGASVASQRKVGKSRFHKLRWLKNMRSDPNLKEALAKSADIMTLAYSNVGNRTTAENSVPLPTVITNPPAVGEIPSLLPTTASNENLLSLDYYSSICDKQLSFESPCKSPGHLMKLNLARRPPAKEALPDSECAIVIAKPSEQRLKIGFDVSPSQTPTTKAAPDNPLGIETVEKNTSDNNPPEKYESTVNSKPTPRTFSLVPKSENANFCDRILQTIVAGVSSRKSSDNELQIPSVTGGGGSPIAARVNRCSPFSFRELGQELKSVVKSSASCSPSQANPVDNANPLLESISKKAD